MFMLLKPDHRITIVQIHEGSNTATSKTSFAPIPRLTSFDSASLSAYAVLRHEEQFVFGTTNYLYESQMSSMSGFVMNLNFNRLTEFSFSSPTSTTLSIDSIEALQTSICAVETNEYVTISSDYTDLVFDRNAFHADFCEPNQTGDTFLCIYDTSD